MHRDDGRWRHGGGIHPPVLSKEEQRGRRCLFIISLGSGTFLKLRRIFARISPNFAEKCFVQLFPTNFLHKNHTTFFGVASKKGFHIFFCKPWARFFEVKQRWAPCLRGLSRMLPRFSENQNFRVCACIFLPPPPTSLLFITAS